MPLANITIMPSDQVNEARRQIKQILDSQWRSDSEWQKLRSDIQKIEMHMRRHNMRLRSLERQRLPVEEQPHQGLQNNAQAYHQQQQQQQQPQNQDAPRAPQNNAACPPPNQASHLGAENHPGSYGAPQQMPHARFANHSAQSQNWHENHYADNESYYDI